ncbi:MAG: hypothetical protein JWN07_701 [Hyphomicrobiales bacterium]|nr:hypothetical protein [Hyphomicrobiales bacterium]
MASTRISSEGQVLIPKAIRDALGIQPGTVLNAEAKDGAVVLRPVAKETRLPTKEEIDAIAGRFDRGPPYPTKEEEEAAIAEMFRRKWKK